LAWGASSPPLPVLDREAECSDNQVLGDLSLGTALRDSLEALTADLFCIRANVWDSTRMEEAIGLQSEMTLLQSVVRAHVDDLDITFHAGDQPLRTLLLQLQKSLLALEDHIESDDEDLVIARLVQSLESRPLVNQSLLGEVQRGCEVLGSEWSTLGDLTIQALSAIQRLVPDRLESIRSNLLQDVGLNYGDDMLEALCRRWRRRQALQLHLVFDERKDLLTIHQAIEASSANRQTLVDDLEKSVASQTRQVKQRIDDFLGPTTREEKEKQRIHKRDLDTLIDVARILTQLSKPLGTLDRLELSMYLSMLKGVRAKWWLRTLRRLASALEKGRLTTIERCYVDVEVILADRSAGQEHRATIAAVQTLRKYAPEPELWLRRLLSKLLEQRSSALSQIDDRSLRRVRRESPILADIIRIGIVEVMEQEITYTGSL
jgi:hypothetical protein